MVRHINLFQIGLLFIIFLPNCQLFLFFQINSDYQTFNVFFLLILYRTIHGYATREDAAFRLSSGNAILHLPWEIPKKKQLYYFADPDPHVH